MSHPDSTKTYEDDTKEIEHKDVPFLFCSCQACETYFTSQAENMRIWQNATAEDTTDQAKEDIEARYESDRYQAEAQYFNSFTE